MLCAKILRVPKSHGVVFNWFENLFVAVTRSYGRGLEWSFRHKWTVIGGALICVGLAVLSFVNLKTEFVPPEDRGFFVSITVAPEGASLQYTDGYQKRVEEIFALQQEIHDVVVTHTPISNGVRGRKQSVTKPLKKKPRKRRT